MAVASALSGASPASAAEEPPPALSGRTAVLIDLDTGKVLFDKNSHERRKMASTAKMMTALLAAELSRPEEIATAYSRDFTLGSKVGIRVGERMTLRDLLHATLMASDNAAATVVGDHVGRTRLGATSDGRAAFVRRMNARAAELGMRNTHFGNAFGDTTGTYSSASDLAKLGRAVLKNPLLAPIVAKSTYRAVGTVNGASISHPVDTTNRHLCSYPGTYGVKGGFTNSAGYLGVEASRRGGTSLMAVVMAAPTRDARFADIGALFDWGYRRAGERGGARSTCEESAQTISYSGTWGRTYDDSYSGGYVKRASAAGARVTLSFQGSAVTWVAPKNSFRGRADVYLDGRKTATVDLYSPSYQARQVVFNRSGLAPGSHTLQIRVLGSKNAASTGTRVDVDAFEVTVAAPR